MEETKLVLFIPWWKMRTINPNLLFTVSQLWTQSVVFFRRTDVLPIEWNHCMECSRVHTLWKWDTSLQCQLSHAYSSFPSGLHSHSFWMLAANEEAAGGGTSLPPPMIISCYCLDLWGYVVCNNKREGAFPRFLMKIPSTKGRVFMYTNIMDGHECINMWHCLNLLFDFQDQIQLKEPHLVFVKLEKRC